MKRTEKLQKLGFFNVHKPSGMVSSKVVNKLKWLTGVPCGHMGTLDPLASGVLPVGVGNATRLFDYFLNKEKEYVAEFTFGVASDTLDSTGELTYGGRIPTAQEIQAVLPSLTGDVLQMPPKYSAKNVNGKRGYELARAGVEFELQPKAVRIDSVELLGEAETENAYNFKIRCGGGTYIRSIARDLAAALGTNAVMSKLLRTKSVVFTLDNAIEFAELEKDPSLAELENFLIPTESVLPFPKLCVSESDEKKLFNGMAVRTEFPDGTYTIDQGGQFYGLAEVTDGKAKTKTKLC
ncbi:MAG: tRNA pseudouridine(55) synthase TruB [Clostridia bacterium]|nr:tRNA pseudouridine(55) synthase TruB [Clostridia bacterium]